jgi:hypothetical protein
MSPQEPTRSYGVTPPQLRLATLRKPTLQNSSWHPHTSGRSPFRHATKPASSSACHGTDCIAVFASQNTEVSPRRLQSKNEDGVASVVALAMSVSTHVHAFRIPSQVPKAKFGSPSASPHPNDSPLLRCASSSCPSLLVGGYRGPDWHPYWT